MFGEPAIGPDIAKDIGREKVHRRQSSQKRIPDNLAPDVAPSYRDFVALTRGNYEGDQRYGGEIVKTARQGPDSRSKARRHSETRCGLMAGNKYGVETYFVDVCISEIKERTDGIFVNGEMGGFRVEIDIQDDHGVL